jgi:hypothetical protein
MKDDLTKKWLAEQNRKFELDQKEALERNQYNF